MLLNIRDIIDLPVETPSGQALGKVEAVMVEVETQSLYQYQVKHGGLAHLFDKAGLLVHRDQVLSISKEKMIVEDSVYRAAEAESAKALIKNKPPLGAEALTRNHH
ncbi:MAG: PRC-barrel domain-containing protein [Patescibacteria group bacterium]|nr:PRC-barrel domain-containing protein [Patescibacteria group bacterium]